MRYWLRNDDEYTVTVEYMHSYGTYLVEVYAGLEQVVHHEFEQAGPCLDLAQKFVDFRISSNYIWALNEDARREPLVRPKSAQYTADCRAKVKAAYNL